MAGVRQASAFKRFITSTHKYIGLIAGFLLALNGLTGAVLAFEPQWLRHYGPEAQRVAHAPGATRLTPDVLLQRALAKNHGRIPTAVIVSADPEAPAKVRFAVQPPMPPGGMPGMGPGHQPGMAPPPGGPPGAGHPGAMPAGGPPGGMAPGAGPGGPPPGFGPPGGGPRGLGKMPPTLPVAFVLVDPYTGAMLPQTTSVSRFFDGLERLHRSMWLGQGPLGKVLRVTLAYCALALLFMALSGLYLRWPKARALQWQTWFKVHTRLKGYPFFYNLHTVVGTCVLLIYLVTAHTGVMIGRQIGWYHSAAMGFRQALGLPGLSHDPLRSVAVDPKAVGTAWTAFERMEPGYKAARLDLPGDPTGPIVVRSGTKALTFASSNGALIATRPIADEDREALAPEVAGGEADLHQPLAAAFLNGNPYVHTGRRFGLVGQFVMMCAALGMPVMFVTGWLMYLRRGKKTKRKVVAATAR